MPIELIRAENVSARVVEIHVINKDRLKEALDNLQEAERAWVNTAGFLGKPGQVCLLPDAEGNLSHVFFGEPNTKGERVEFQFGKLASVLPAGTYKFSQTPSNETLVALSWILESYQFTRYKDATEEKLVQLVVADDVMRIEATRMGQAATFTRDLVNTPTNDMGPDDLAAIVLALAQEHGAHFDEVVGDELLKQNFPLIHAVGRASDKAPRLLDMRWGNNAAPKVTLVGKGVCFDTGGLNIKTGNYMTLMKKDMGGAANVLGLARMIMDARLPICLRVLIPAVENSIAGNSFRPGDILPSRLGLSVEITNTDAEGRLVLADALAYADEEAPDVLIDMATLTGAARVALGPDLSPFYTNDDAFADELSVRARDMADPVWRMPLWDPYQSMLDTPIADVNHAPAGGFAGSITAALFLARFVKFAEIWGHFDIYAWTPNAKPARPKGGEAQAIRALYALLKARFS